MEPRLRRITTVAVVLAVVLVGSSVALAFAGTSPTAHLGMHGALPTAPQDAMAPTSGHASGARDLGLVPEIAAVPTWHNVTRTGPGEAPPAAWLGTTTYDPADRETVAFGGCSVSVCPENYTWVYQDGQWTNITNPLDAPPARAAAAMDYDANMHGLLLFGGVGNSGYLSDTWLFSGGHWTNLTWVGPSPPARIYAMLAFDPAPGENGSVLFGGYNVHIGFFNDTWVWEGGAGWVVENTTVQPPYTDAASMTYDPAASAMLLYGGGDVSSTWELYGGQWWQLNIPSPPYRYGAGMVFDNATSSVILFGGINGTTYLNDLWSFSGGAWSSVSFGTPPSPRGDMGLTLDPSGSVPLLYGGTNATESFNDCLLYTSPSPRDPKTSRMPSSA